jgi:hypothetical protein
MANNKLKNQMNMKIYLSILLNFLIVMSISCTKQNNNQLKNNNIMTEKYDFELMKKFKANGALDTIIHRENMLVFVNSMFENGTFCNEYPPVPEFYLVQKRYYPNGNIQATGKLLGRNLAIGIWRYYNEEGKLIKEEDEDAKFGKVKIGQILKFIEKEGWIDLSTGKGREEIVYTTDLGRGYIKNGIFTLHFFKKGEDPIQYNDYPIWVITIEACPETNFYETNYEIHGETGEVLKKDTEQILRTE